MTEAMPEPTDDDKGLASEALQALDNVNAGAYLPPTAPEVNALARFITKARQAGREEEREACLKIIEIWAYSWTDEADLIRQMAGNIRKRSAQSGGSDATP